MKGVPLLFTFMSCFADPLSRDELKLWAQLLEPFHHWFIDWFTSFLPVPLRNRAGLQHGFKNTLSPEIMENLYQPGVKRVVKGHPGGSVS